MGAVDLMDDFTDDQLRDIAHSLRCLSDSKSHIIYRLIDEVQRHRGHKCPTMEDLQKCECGGVTVKLRGFHFEGCTRKDSGS